MGEMRHGPGKAHDNHLGDRVDDPLIDRLHWIIRQAIRVLAVLMVAVIPVAHALVIASGVALVGGPLAYYVAGRNFHAVEMLASPWLVYGSIAVVWGLVTPMLLAMADRWLPAFDPPAARKP